MSDHRGHKRHERMKVRRPFRTRDEPLRTSAWVATRIPEQGFRRCFAEGLNQGLVSSVTQATKCFAREWPKKTADGWRACFPEASESGLLQIILFA